MADHPKILLVEDDRLLRMDLVLVLGREGFDLDTATCAADAIDMLGRDRYALVLTDLGLPDESGFEVLHAAKRADPMTKVVVVTGSQSGASAEEIKLEGVETVILKPFPLAHLVDTVRRLAV
jgi:DNA-binding NtrC family response regulator